MPQLVWGDKQYVKDWSGHLWPRRTIDFGDRYLYREYDRRPQSDTFHCFRYVGARPLGDAARRDMTQATPALLLIDWFNKPRSMSGGTYRSREEAITWAWNEHERLLGTGQFLTQLGPTGRPREIGDYSPVRDSFPFWWTELGHDNAVVIHQWMVNNRQCHFVILPSAWRERWTPR